MSSVITDPPHPSLMILIFHPHCLPYIHLFLLLPHVLIGLSHTIHFTPSSSLHSIPLFIFLTLLTTTPPAYPQHWAYHMTYLPSLSMPNYVSLLLYQPSLMTMPKCLPLPGILNPDPTTNLFLYFTPLCCSKHGA